jgi:hypothetical protein
MSFSTSDFLNNISSHNFEIQIPAAFTTKANANVNVNTNANAKANTTSKQQNKKRKADIASLSTSTTASQAGNTKSSQNTTSYLQLAVDNLMLALNKETDLLV